MITMNIIETTNNENKHKENNYFNHKEPTHKDKQYWLKQYVDYNELIEYALDEPRIISILYNYFHK